MRKEDAFQQWGDYRGWDCQPADFEEFWAVAKKEVEDLGLDYQLIPFSLTSHQVDAYELTYRGVGGARIFCQLLKPKSYSGSLPVIFQFHGYHTHSGDWTDKVGMAAEGAYVVAMDVRGQGGQSEDGLAVSHATVKGHLIRGVEEGPERLFYRSVYQDIYQLTRILMSFEDVDRSRLVSSGASQGGALALVCAALTPEIAYSFVQYPFLSDIREAYRLDVEQSAYEEIAYYFRFRDSLHEREEAFFNCLDYIDIHYLAPWIRAEVWWAMGLEDKVCHPKTQFATFNQLQTSKQLRTFPEYGHEYLPAFGDEIRRVLFDKGVV